MGFAAVFLRCYFVSIFLLSGALATSLTKNLTCRVFHNEADRVYVWERNETHSIDIVLLRSTLRPSMTCLLKNKSYTAKLLIHILRPNNGTQLAKQQLNFSVEGTNNEFSFTFGDGKIDIKERGKWPIRIWILAAAVKQLIFRGFVVQLGHLPSFSNSSLNHTFVQSFFRNTTWKFYRYSCIQGLVYIVPQVLSEVKYGFPLGMGFASRQLTIIKWENVTTGLSLDQSFNIIFYNSMLFIHNTSHFYFMQSGKALIFTRATFPFKMKEVLSIAFLPKCLEKTKDQWFDLTVVLRLQNSSIAMAFGEYPYMTWQQYILPEWLTQATHATVEIDIERYIALLAMNIGQPQKTLLVNIDVRLRGTVSVTESVPTVFGRMLNNPKIKTTELFPAILMHDESEIWLSTDAGYNFRRIFLAESATKILAVECLESNSLSLFIVTSHSVIMYAASVFKSLSLTRSRVCVTGSRLILPASRGNTLYVVCGSEVVEQNGRSHVLKVNQDALVIPSTIVRMINDFEFSFGINYYKGIHQFKQNFANLCNIEAFPYVRRCSLRIQGDHTMITRRRMEAGKYTNCSFELRQHHASLYFINVFKFRGGQCNLWTAGKIGQTLTILDVHASCWIYWLVNETTALANCSNHVVIGSKRNVHNTYASIVDSRGDESCVKTHLSLLPTNKSGLFEVKFNDTAAGVERVQSYLRIFDFIGGLSVIDKKRYVRFLGNYSIWANEFKYVCIIGKMRSEKNAHVPSRGATCRYDIQYSGLTSTSIFLDANDKVDFNISLKLTNRKHGIPYIDEIPPLEIQAIEPSHVEVQIRSYMRLTPMHIRVLIKQRSNINGTSVLTVYATTQLTTCNGSLKAIKIHGMCPPGKHLKFEYPLLFNRHTWLYENPVDAEDNARIATLPYNYQPPSYLGKAIPLTPNVYNADPSKPMYRDSYKISRDITRFKQCKGKATRPQCQCTLDMTISVKPELSDCIQRAYRVSSEEKFLPKLYLIQSGGKKSPLSFPYCLTEVNNRTDFTINNKVSANCLSMQANSSLTFKAVGLFHFKVMPDKPGHSFCKLDTHFLVFVASTNLPSPSKDLVRVMTAFCFGTIILCAFWVQHYAV